MIKTFKNISLVTILVAMACIMVHNSVSLTYTTYAATPKKTSVKKVTPTPKKKPQPTPNPKKPIVTKPQKKVIGAKVLAFIPFSGFEKCTGPDGKVAYAPKKDCDNLWSFWNSHKPSTPSNNSNSGNSNNSNNNASNTTPTATPVPTTVPTTQPTPTTEPTTAPTATPTATQSVTPTVTPTATPSVTPTPVKTNALKLSYYTIPSGGQGLKIVNGPDGNLWFMVDRTGPNGYKFPENVVLENPIIGSIGKITPSGDVTELFLPSSSNIPLKNMAPGEYMFDLTVGPDNNLWYTQPNANLVGKVTTDGTITEYNFTNQGFAPRQITSGQNGSIVFDDFNHGLVMLDTAGNVTGNVSGAYGMALATGTDGTTWVGGYPNNTLTKIATDSSTTKFKTPAGPVNMIEGDNDSMWLSENGGYLTNITKDGNVTVYQTPSEQAWVLAKDLDGNIWYKDSIENKILKLDPSTGNIAKYSFDTDEKYVSTDDLVLGPDGNLWFTDYGKIGKIDINNASQITPTPVIPTIVQIPNADPKINKVTVLACTSSSCGGITTIVIEGQNFATDASVSLASKELNALGNEKYTYNSNQNGQIVNREGTTKITVDFYNIACGEYRLLSVFSPSAGKSASYFNLDLRPYTCN